MFLSASHVVEWCLYDRSLRVRSVADFVATNVESFYEGTPREYAPIGFFESREQADQFVAYRLGENGLN